MAKFKKSLLVLIFMIVPVFAFGFSTPKAYAATQEQMQLQIQDLMQKIIVLMQELIKIQSKNLENQSLVQQDQTQTSNDSQTSHNQNSAQAAEGTSSCENYGDNGKDYYTKGSCNSTFANDNGSIDSDTYTESCSGDTLTEYWCQTDDLGNETLRRETYICPKGCNDGACEGANITILSPSENKIYHEEGKLNIIWESIGISQSDKINIWLVEYNGLSNPTDYMIVVNLAGNLGAYDWQIPSGFNSDYDYEIKIEAYRDGNLLTKKESTGYFSIAQ